MSKEIYERLTDTQLIDALEELNRRQGEASLIFWENHEGQKGWAITEAPGIVTNKIHPTIRQAIRFALANEIPSESA